MRNIHEGGENSDFIPPRGGETSFQDLNPIAESFQRNHGFNFSPEIHG